MPLDVGWLAGFASASRLVSQETFSFADTMAYARGLPQVRQPWDDGFAMGLSCAFGIDASGSPTTRSCGCHRCEIKRWLNRRGFATTAHHWRDLTA